LIGGTEFLDIIKLLVKNNLFKNKSKMKISGRITVVLPLQEGTSTNGAWSKQTAIVEESEGQYPQSLAFDMFKDKIVALTVGQQVEVDFDTKAREYQGKWFNNVNAWKVTVIGQSAPAAPVADHSMTVPPARADKDLPF
jgi:hypothetical protein